jgi:hypothetical protein
VGENENAAARGNEYAMDGFIGQIFDGIRKGEFIK